MSLERSNDEKQVVESHIVEHKEINAYALISEIESFREKLKKKTDQYNYADISKSVVERNIKLLQEFYQISTTKLEIKASDEVKQKLINRIIEIYKEMERTAANETVIINNLVQELNQCRTELQACFKNLSMDQLVVCINQQKKSIIDENDVSDPAVILLDVYEKQSKELNRKKKQTQTTHLEKDLFYQALYLKLEFDDFEKVISVFSKSQLETLAGQMEGEYMVSVDAFKQSEQETRLYSKQDQGRKLVEQKLDAWQVKLDALMGKISLVSRNLEAFARDAASEQFKEQLAIIADISKNETKEDILAIVESLSIKKTEGVITEVKDIDVGKISPEEVTRQARELAALKADFEKAQVENRERVKKLMAKKGKESKEDGAQLGKVTANSSLRTPSETKEMPVVEEAPRDAYQVREESDKKNEKKSFWDRFSIFNSKPKELWPNDAKAAPAPQLQSMSSSHQVDRDLFDEKELPTIKPAAIKGFSGSNS